MVKNTRKEMDLEGHLIDPLYKGFEFNVSPIDVSSNGFYAVMGPSGAGKESRGKYLADLTGSSSKLSSGDVFRKIMQGFSTVDIEKMCVYGRDNPELIKEVIDNEPSLILDILDEVGVKYKDSLSGKLGARAAFETANGYFVDETAYAHFIEDQLKENWKTSSKGRFVFDGHIRTDKQVNLINRILHNQIGQGLDGVLLVHTPLDILKTRTVGRLSCPTCKSNYNVTFSLDHEEYPENVFTDSHSGLKLGYCKHDGDLLKRRSDDKPRKVENRLNEYKENISGVLNQLDLSGVKVWVVSGNLPVYSKSEMQKSVDESLNGYKARVLSRF